MEIEPTEGEVKMVNGHIVQVCPPGIAAGAFDLRSRGRGIDYGEITVWPKREHFRLFTGGERKWRDINFGTLMFQQEIYVYMRELGFAIESSLDSLKVNVAEENVLKCGYCKIEFQSARKKKYCCQSCCLKAQAWKSLQRIEQKQQAEVRQYLIGMKPKIGKQGNYWRISGINAEGTYEVVKKRFSSFTEAAAFIVAMQKAA